MERLNQLKEIIIEYKSKILIGSILIFISVISFFNNTPINSKITDSKTTSSLTIPTENSTSTKESSKTTSDKMYVDIKGAVNNPGVYEIQKNSRLIDIIKKAGGLKEANESCLNLSEKLADEEMIVIPSQKEKCEKSTESLSQNNNSNSDNNENSSTNSSKVNLNTASLEELETLNRIGESKAKAIIKYREENGKFTKIEDLQNVEGIGEATFQNLKDQIEV